VTTDRVSTPASSSSASAWLVLTICISAKAPSCMRAPPEAVTRRNGERVRNATRAARAIRSPTPTPRLPPMNRKSMTAATTGCPCSVPVTQVTASRSPVDGLGDQSHDDERSAFPSDALPATDFGAFARHGTRVRRCPRRKIRRH
jgi:hypothetical protein